VAAVEDFAKVEHLLRAATVGFVFAVVDHAVQVVQVHALCVEVGILISWKTKKTD
jgi:hypothetical protein